MSTVTVKMYRRWDHEAGGYEYAPAHPDGGAPGYDPAWEAVVSPLDAPFSIDIDAARPYLPFRVIAVRDSGLQELNAFETLNDALSYRAIDVAYIHHIISGERFSPTGELIK